MSLTPYRKKRNPKKTPEPFTSHPSHNGSLHFVIQKHAASHLHYDFRLENHGVLKSWAVPKGISLDPSVKRLAMEVEDHPYDYRTFEGIIPPGNYGAGTVMVWDEGEYYADQNLSKEENEKLIAEQWKKGNLKFFLNGKKLKGNFALVKMRGRGKGNEWLILKKDDEFANKPIPHEDQSVQTGRTLEAISQKSKKVWISNRTSSGEKKEETSKDHPNKKTSWSKSVLKDIDFTGAMKSSLPENIKPMLATLVDKPFDRKGWIFELKWDGYRILSQIKNKDVRLYTRNNNTYNETFPQLVRELKKCPFDAVFDGELVILDENGVSQFQLLQNYMRTQEGTLAYYIFDILYLNGYDLHRLTLKRRLDILKKITVTSDLIRLSDSIEEKGIALFEAAEKNKLEGIIAKDLESPYQFDQRSSHWLKIKIVHEQEAIICGFTKPRGGRKHFGALILGIYKDKTLTYIGHTGGGFNDQSLKSLSTKLQPLITNECPFKIKPKTNMPVTWVKPQLMCQVKFQEWTSDGSMRQPIFLGLREDKKPTEVYKETPKPTKKIIPAQKPKPDPKTSSTSSKKYDIQTKASLTHLDKIFWPEEGYTKGDVIQYYQTIAAFILPYLKDRPESLLRHPHGIDHEGFFQKNISDPAPTWVKTVPMKSESTGETINYLLCQNKDTLAYMNNLGCIEINPWNSVAQNPDHPDYILLDFDPVDVPNPQIMEVVLTAKDIMDKAGLTGYCKTSGGRGMHVHIPLKRKYTFDQAKDFVHFLCMVIQQKTPGLTSLERSPSKRKGLVYLDYLQNRQGATTASAYSLRPRPHATISTPLEWKEVTRDLNPVEFNLKTIHQRLKKKGDLWKGVLGPGINMKKCLGELEKLYSKE
jgi:bifunctional non-homologous end joining protein LigD